MTGLGNALFPRVRLRLLGVLFGEADRAFQTSELIRLLDSGTGAVQRELKKLTDSGIVTMTISANRKLYQANRQSPIFDELHGIILKTVGLLEPIRRALRRYRGAIEIAFVYGSVARGKDTARSDIDLLIIGANLAYSEVYSALQTAEQTLRRHVNPTIVTRQEWKQKLASQNSFMRNLLRQSKFFVFGSERELERIGQSGEDRVAEARAG